MITMSIPKSKFLFYWKVRGFLIEQVDIEADTGVDAEKELFIVLEVQGDIPSMLHEPRTVYVGKNQYPISRETALFVGLQTTSELVNVRLERIARKKNDHF